MKKSYDLPEVVDKDPSEIKSIIEQIKTSSLSDDVKKFVVKCVELALWLPIFLQSKAISIHRLRTIIFGKGYNKKDNIDTKPVPPVNSTHATDSVDPNSQTEPPKPTTNQVSPESINPDNTNSSAQQDGTVASDITTTDATSNVFSTDAATSNDTKENIQNKKPGHGRHSHTDYTDAVDIQLLLNLTIGDDCPLLCGGRLGPYKPGVIIRIKGQNFAQAYRYYLEQLRCNLCGVIVKPEKPADMGDEKYDASFKAMLALMKYYVAIPFSRQEQFQRILGFPLSDATQWDLIEQLAGYCYAVFNVLKRMAANGYVMHNDDTMLRILEIIKQIKNGTIGDRTGMYTTGIIADYEGHRIALFINGQQHSGENVGDILKYRSPEKEPIIQMCDALNANVPKAIQTILSNCLSHGFRKFDELRDYFPAECIVITRLLSRVFKYDQDTRAMRPDERLAYHQVHSKPLMDELERYMATLITERRVEPNSELGQAIKYMQKHWPKLTRFLTVAGAPIDNNIVERALKIAIRNRKAAMFYRTTYSASIGGMITSLIYTCDLAKKNPYDYLIALQEHHAKVVLKPEHWLPWNYQDTMASLANAANPPAHAPPPDCLAAA
jgi:transposase